MKQLGLIIGRFQPLHLGHMKLIERSLSENIATLVCIGSINKQDEKNPYSFEERKEFLNGEFKEKNIFVVGLPDFENDDDWIDHILLHIPERISEVQLYCGDRSGDYAVQVLTDYIDKLPFVLNVYEISRHELAISATEIRDLMRIGDRDIVKQKIPVSISQKIL